MKSFLNDEWVLHSSPSNSSFTPYSFEQVPISIQFFASNPLRSMIWVFAIINYVSVLKMTFIWMKIVWWATYFHFFTSSTPPFIPLRLSCLWFLLFTWNNGFHFINETFTVNQLTTNNIHLDKWLCTKVFIDCIAWNQDGCYLYFFDCFHHTRAQIQDDFSCQWQNMYWLLAIDVQISSLKHLCNGICQILVFYPFLWQTHHWS